MLRQLLEKRELAFVVVVVVVVVVVFTLNRMSFAKCQNLAINSRPVVTKVLEPSEDLKNTNIARQKAGGNKPEEVHLKNPCNTMCVPKPPELHVRPYRSTTVASPPPCPTLYQKWLPATAYCCLECCLARSPCWENTYVGHDKKLAGQAAV